MSARSAARLICDGTAPWEAAQTEGVPISKVVTHLATHWQLTLDGRGHHLDEPLPCGGCGEETAGAMTLEQRHARNEEDVRVLHSWPLCYPCWGEMTGAGYWNGDPDELPPAVRTELENRIAVAVEVAANPARIYGDGPEAHQRKLEREQARYRNMTPEQRHRLRERRRKVA